MLVSFATQSSEMLTLFIPQYLAQVAGRVAPSG
jgi:hypothetical protein